MNDDPTSWISPLALVFASGTIHAPLLSLCTARDAFRTKEVGNAEAKENKKVSLLVTGPEAKIGVVEFVAAMCFDTPFIPTLWHDEDLRAFTTRVVQGTDAL